MIDDFTLLFSTLMALYVAIRAARLNRLRPWFETRPRNEEVRPPRTAVAAPGQAMVSAARRPAPPAPRPAR
jgi:hypothetical protein